MARGKKKEAALTPEERLQAALVPDWEQPYKVPENWCWVKLSSLSQTISKGTTPTGGKSAYLTDGVKFLRVENINDDGTISHEHIAFVSEEMHRTVLKRSMLEENDILVSIAGTLGKTGLVRKIDLPMNTNQAVSFVRLRSSQINKLFIKYAIDSPKIQEHLLSQTKVTSIPNLTLEIIGGCPIPLPPFSEQYRIVTRIESLFAKLDEAKEKAQAVVDGFETRRAAILHRAFTGGLTARWRKKHCFSLENWKTLTLNDIANYKKGPFGSSLTKEMFVPKGPNTYKVYEQGNAIRKTIDYGRYYISQNKYEAMIGFSVVPGDIIISCAGTIGEVFKLPNNSEPGIINQALMRVRLFPIIDESFFIYYFGEILRSDVIDQANGTAIKNIPPFKVMKAMKILLPELNEQKEIVRILDSLLAKEQRAKEAAEGVLERIELIKKAILARAFRGELGTNEPGEESAVEMLKKTLLCDTDESPASTAAQKRITIPKKISEKLSTGMERDIVKLLYKADKDDVPLSEIMSLSSKKFDLLDTIRALENKNIIRKNEKGDYVLVN